MASVRCLEVKAKTADRKIKRLSCKTLNWMFAREQSLEPPTDAYYMSSPACVCNETDLARVCPVVNIARVAATWPMGHREETWRTRFPDVGFSAY